MANERMMQISKGLITAKNHSEYHLARAHEFAEEHGFDAPVFPQVALWEEDVVDAIREAGFDQVYIADYSSGTLEILHAFQNAGGKMGDIYTISWRDNLNHENRLSGIKITF